MPHMPPHTRVGSINTSTYSSMGQLCQVRQVLFLYIHDVTMTTYDFSPPY